LSSLFELSVQVKTPVPSNGVFIVMATKVGALGAIGSVVVVVVEEVVVVVTAGRY
jgi:hypothetical protein